MSRIRRGWARATHDQRQDIVLGVAVTAVMVLVIAITGGVVFGSALVASWWLWRAIHFWRAGAASN